MGGSLDLETMSQRNHMVSDIISKNKIVGCSGQRGSNGLYWGVRYVVSLLRNRKEP